MANTIFIFDELDAELRFFSLSGNYSHLDGVYINSTKTYKFKQDELTRICYGEEGNFLPVTTNRFPVEEVKADTIVITCGFLP